MTTASSTTHPKPEPALPLYYIYGDTMKDTQKEAQKDGKERRFMKHSNEEERWAFIVPSLFHTKMASLNASGTPPVQSELFKVNYIHCSDHAPDTTDGT